MSLDPFLSFEVYIKRVGEPAEVLAARRAYDDQRQAIGRLQKGACEHREAVARKGELFRVLDAKLQTARQNYEASLRPAREKLAATVGGGPSPYCGSPTAEQVTADLAVKRAAAATADERARERNAKEEQALRKAYGWA